MSVAKQSPALEGNAWAKKTTYGREPLLDPPPRPEFGPNPVVTLALTATNAPGGLALMFSVGETPAACNMIIPPRTPTRFRFKELARPVALGRQAYPGESYEKEPNPENGRTNIRAAPDDLPNNQPSTTLTTLPRFPRRPINHQLAKLSTTRRHTRKSIPFLSCVSCISWSAEVTIPDPYSYPPRST